MRSITISLKNGHQQVRYLGLHFSHGSNKSETVEYEVNYVLVCVILSTSVFSHMPISNQARICVLGFSAIRVWLVSHFRKSRYTPVAFRFDGIYISRVFVLMGFRYDEISF